MSIKKGWIFLLFLILSSKTLFGASASQVLTIAVSPQTAITIVGPPPVFDVSNVGMKFGQRTELSNAKTCFIAEIAPGDAEMKIVAQLSTDLPEGFELFAYCSAPAGGAISTGFQSLSATEVDVVRNLSPSTSNEPNVITYHLTFGRQGLNSGTFSREIILTLLEQ